MFWHKRGVSFLLGSNKHEPAVHGFAEGRKRESLLVGGGPCCFARSVWRVHSAPETAQVSTRWRAEYTPRAATRLHLLPPLSHTDKRTAIRGLCHRETGTYPEGLWPGVRVGFLEEGRSELQVGGHMFPRDGTARAKVLRREGTWCAHEAQRA